MFCCLEARYHAHLPVIKKGLYSVGTRRWGHWRPSYSLHFEIKPVLFRIEYRAKTMWHSTQNISAYSDILMTVMLNIIINIIILGNQATPPGLHSEFQASQPRLQSGNCLNHSPCCFFFKKKNETFSF